MQINETTFKKAIAGFFFAGQQYTKDQIYFAFYDLQLAELSFFIFY